MLSVNDASLVVSAGRWPYLPALERLGLALALGTFIGMERERRGKDAGMRTFALVCLLGAMGGLLGTAYALVALGLVAVLILLTDVQAIIGSKTLELTTSATLGVVAFLGVLCGLGHTLTPVAVGVVVVGLLAWKEQMVLFTVGLTEQEVRSAILLAIIAFVIYPALPEGTVDRWGLVDVRTAWVTVILIAGIGFVNYILLKRYGSRGVELTGFLGGLISTTVTTAELAKRCKESDGALAEETYRGVLLSRASMVLRNGFIMALLSMSAFLVSAFSLVLMLIGSTWFLVFGRKRAASQADEAPALAIASPFSLKSVLKYGVLFLLLQVFGVLAERSFGSFGFYAVTAVGSLVSSASAVSSAAALAAHGQISAVSAGIGAVVANLISSAVDALLVARITQDGRLSRRLARGTAFICVLGIIGTIATVAVLR